MKKLLVIAAVSVFVLGSCKKDYTCSCTTTAAGVSNTVTTTLTGKKKDVETACTNGSSSFFGVTTVCEIK